jgi:hypothetical protein
MRVTFTGSTLDTVPYAAIAWAGAAADDTAILTLTSAPSGVATMKLAAAQRTGNTAENFATGATATLAGSSTAITLGAGSADDSLAYLTANVAGTYAGYIQAYNAGAVGQKATFTLTTTGAASSLTMVVNKASLPKSTVNTKVATLTVKDATGKATQLITVDGVTMTTTETGAALDDTTPTSYALYDGTADIGVGTAATAGSFTLTATPTGTPWGSAQTGTYAVIDNVAATSLSMVDSASTLNVATATAGSGNGIISPGTTSATFAITVSTANAGKPVVLTVGGTAWTALGLTAPGASVVTTDAAGKGTLTVSGIPAASAATPTRTVTVTGTTVGTYTAAYTTGVVYCEYTTRTPSAGTIAVPTGTAQPVSFVVDDSYGNPTAGYVVTATATGLTTQTGVTDAQGKVTLTLPAPTNAATTSATWAFAWSGVPAVQIGGCKDLTIQFSASGAVTIGTPTINGSSATAYTGVGSASNPAVVPYDGYVRKYDATTAADGKLVKLGATVGVGNVNVALSGPAGVWFCTDDDTNQLGTAAFGLNCSESALTYTASGTALSVYVQATKVGTHRITATTTSGATQAWDLTFGSPDAAARNITLSADPAKVSVGSTSAVTLAVTDVFGNPVAMTTGGAKVVLVTDRGTLAGGTNIFEVDVTTSGGTATVSLASSISGIATVTGTATGGQFGNAVNVPYTGAAKSVSSATVPVEFTAAPTAKAIVISGERGTVSGKPGVIIDGSTTGFENGKTVIPYFRFPGETSYTEGTARPVINDGDFTWERKTGKKFYAYVTSDDGAVQSNRIIIAAN